ncbi:MAG TPA: hypothetical protein ENN67_06105, partial [Firmicutes bacterium]|nr:hypothetical protein [Bacillota bacterium]
MRTMTSRERMLTALDLGTPDRLPASVHGWMTYYLENYLGGISAEEAFIKFGLDWSLYLPWEVWTAEFSDSWIVEKSESTIDSGRVEIVTTIKTPVKTFRQVTHRDKYKSPWVVSFPLYDPEDIFIYCKNHPREIFDHYLAGKMFARLSDNGILRAARVGPWHKLCELYSAEKMIYECFDNPQWVHDALGALTEIEIHALETMKGSKVDLLETGGGHASSTVVSPEIFANFILPVEKKIHAFIREELGIRTVYHTCGGMMPILDLLV